MESGQADHDQHEVPPHRHLRLTGRYILDERQRSPVWAWALTVAAFVGIIGIAGASATGVAVFSIYQPEKMNLQVTDGHLELLDYNPDAHVIRGINVTIDMVAKNANAKAEVSFSDLFISVGFHGTDLAYLEANPFKVARNSSVQLPYHVVATEAPLGDAGARAMREALGTGRVPIDVYGKALMTWKVGGYPKRKFWTRISCSLVFSYPDGNLLSTDPSTCRSSWSL